MKGLGGSTQLREVHGLLQLHSPTVATSEPVVNAAAPDYRPDTIELPCRQGRTDFPTAHRLSRGKFDCGW